MILDLTATLGDVGGLMPEGVQHKAAAAMGTGMATATAGAGAGATVMTSMSSVEAVVALQPVGHPKAYTGPTRSAGVTRRGAARDDASSISSIDSKQSDGAETLDSDRVGYAPRGQRAGDHGRHPPPSSR